MARVYKSCIKCGYLYEHRVYTACPECGEEQVSIKETHENNIVNTWEMIKMLTESNKPFGELFFKTIHDKDEPIICFLRPVAGSIEFRLFQSWDDNYICDNIILYPTFKWVEMSKAEADVWLKGNYDLI